MSPSVSQTFGGGGNDGGRGTYQTTVDDLARGLLHLPQLGNKVPEAGFGHDVVGGEDPHAVQRGGRVLGRGQQAPNDLILPKLWTQKVPLGSIRTQRCTAALSVDPWIHFQRHRRAPERRQGPRFCQHARQAHTTAGGSFGFGCVLSSHVFLHTHRSDLHLIQK